MQFGHLKKYLKFLVALTNIMERYNQLLFSYDFSY